MSAGFVRQCKEMLKAGMHNAFGLGQRMGINILPNHFYSAIPDLRDLRNRTDWRSPLSMVGVQGADLQPQIAFVEQCCAGIAIPPDLHQEAAARNGEGSGYGVIEADFLFAFVVRHQPATIVQIGCGVSTEVIRAAAGHAGYKPKIICIEPYPTANLRKLADQGEIVLRHEAAQATPLESIESLSANDLFFVDSTHTVKVGSEVNRIILEMLPRLAPGVWVHFHDITFPYDYPRAVFDNLFLNSESTLLHAFLIGNDGFRIEASLSMLHYAAPDQLKAALPGYRPQGNENGLRCDGGEHFPSATWLRVT